MTDTYERGEVLVWTRVDEGTGETVHEFVTVMGVRAFTGRPYYQVMSQASGEPAGAWHDELARWEPA